MVSTRHPTIEELSDWRLGGAEGEEVIAIARHLATCDACANTAVLSLGLDRAADALCDDIAPSRPPVRSWLLALAASIAIALFSGFWRTVSVPAAPPVERVHPMIRSTPPAPESGAPSALLARVRGGASIGMPDVLRSLRPKQDVLRGATSAGSALSPAGVVLKTAQPLFTWPAAKGSRAMVQVFQGDEEIAHSGVLTTSQWRPERALTRGMTYTWSVRIEHDGITEILPASPAPTARFHILDAGTLAAVDGARHDHPDDHFLLGVLLAQAGLEDEARMHLRLITDPRDAAIARRVLREIDSWTTP
jgi:hypothetical protein